MHVAKNNDVQDIVWVGIPYASGCPWKHLNNAKKVATGDRVFSGKLIKAVSKLCKLIRFLRGDFVWEWPDKCDLGKDWRFKALTSRQGSFVSVSASAVGWIALLKDHVVRVKKRWKLWSTHPSIAVAFILYQQDPDASSKTFVGCSGTFAKKSCALHAEVR